MPGPRVVIVGAGFAGLTLARALRWAPLEVTLVDRNNYHLFTPLLYQVASALLDPSEIAQPVRALTRPLRNLSFRLGEVSGVDLERRVVSCGGDEIPYDHLVLATGSVNKYFGNRSVAENALGLKALPEALELRNTVLSRFERAAATTDELERRRLLTFAVVGGGPTGVEFAGALSELIHLVLRKDFRDLDLALVRVVLMEGSATLLASFAAPLRAAAARALGRKGVEVWFDALVQQLDGGLVRLADGRSLETETVVWTAGVRGSELGAALGRHLDHHGRVAVTPALHLDGHPEVFVIGDLALLEQGGEPLPMLIPVAMQQARCVARSLRYGSPVDFEYRDPGIMATIGRNQAVAQLGRVRLSGFAGWLMWLAVHLVNVLTFRARLVVLLNWAWEYFFTDRPVRLIVAPVGPRTRSTPPLSDAGAAASASPRPAPSPPPRPSSSTSRR